MGTANFTTPSPDVSAATELKTDTQTTLIFPVINDLLGNLRIIEPIAAGGMAVVYKVKHEELEVIRAAKVLKPGFTEETRQRLFTEAKISANLHHPNIVQIYNVALWKGAVPYIEMEFVHGTPLKELISRHTRLPFLVASAIASIVCRALAFAHQQTYSVYGKTYHGLVHRDIKPANILIASDGSVKLADFGIALPGFVSIHTNDSVIMGTSPYLSPEQIRGELLDHRSDIYSLGTVLYEMLTGLKAFPQPVMPALMHAKLKGKYNSVKSLAPEVPNLIASIVDKSLASDQDKRYDNAEAFGEALDKAIRQFTDQPPSQLVKDFVEGTQSERMPFVTTKRRTTANSRFFVSLGTSLIIITLLLAGGLLLFDRFYRFGSRRAAPPVLGEAGLAVSSAHPRAATVPLPSPSHPADAPSAAVSAKPAPARHFPATRDIAAQRQDAAAPLRTRMHRAEDAAISAQQSVVAATRDGSAPSSRFAQGRQSYLAGSYEEAEELLRAARFADATAGSPEWIDITYYWALNRSALFDRKPNAENRLRARTAWEEFAKAACSERQDDARCEEARKKAAALIR